VTTNGVITIAAAPTSSSTSTMPTATMNCTVEPHGAAPAPPTVCNVSATYDGTTNVPSNYLTTSWDWGDGGTTSTAATPLGSHNYLQEGTYLAVATVTWPGSASSPTTSKSLAIQ
jgi:hypothetical protein